MSRVELANAPPDAEVRPETPSPRPSPGRPRGAAALTALFAVTLLTSASLIFCVQPMVARMILPMLGGSPSVWSTCMVFFQAALLAGYAYAHAISARLGLRGQVVTHLVVLMLALMALPFAIGPATVRAPAAGSEPSLWLLGVLVGSVGLPFFAGAATAPLLQKWFAATGHPAGKDPYFLYAASNLGSLIALLSYPTLIEPRLRLAEQSSTWAVGYGVLVALTCGCAIAALRAPRRPLEVMNEAAGTARPRLGERLAWVGLAFLPSSLMLGVTTYLSIDVASIPLFWIVPLALYLVTFILAFARRQVFSPGATARALRFAMLVLVLLLCLHTVQLIFIPVHLLVFFLAALFCHGELARRRPSVEHLTGFYLAISLGGVLGGAFNALVAPVLFRQVVEYPLALALTCLVLPGLASGPTSASPVRKVRARLLDFALPAALGGLVLAARVSLSGPSSDAIAIRPDHPGIKLVYGLGILACFSYAGRPVRFALGVAALLAGGLLVGRGTVLHRDRGFFGTLCVERVEPGPYHQLIHGNTLHGQQSLDPARSGEPLTYYHRTGPVGQVFDMFNKRPRAGRSSVAVVGLGTGTLAAYARQGGRWTFYEIDPSVARIARDPAYFTFLRDCRASAWDVVLGDARLRLRDAPEHDYDLLVLDAFSSDAIPAHLLTREALALYRGKLAPGGLLVVHISNRYFDLAPVLGALARADGLACRVRGDNRIDLDDQRLGKTGSTWAVLAEDPADLGPLAADPAWVEPPPRPGEAAWTDDFSSLFGHLRLD